MRLTCPTCKSSFKAGRIRQHCLNGHHYTEMQWQQFLRQQGSQTVVNLLENRVSKERKSAEPLKNKAPGELGTPDVQATSGEAMATTTTRPTLDEMKARIAELESQLARPITGTPFSRHDVSCHFKETGHYSAKCARCKRLMRKKARKRAAARASKRKAVRSRKPRARQGEERVSVYTVSGGLPSLGKRR
jgi:hypothetical protein